MHKVNKALQSHECSVAFVAMVNILFDTEFVECEYTTDAKHNLLLDTIFDITAIELVCNTAIPFRVEVIVCIKEIETDAPHFNLPKISINSSSRVRNVNCHRCAVVIEYLLKRKI